MSFNELNERKEDFNKPCLTRNTAFLQRYQSDVNPCSFVVRGHIPNEGIQGAVPPVFHFKQLFHFAV